MLDRSGRRNDDTQLVLGGWGCGYVDVSVFRSPEICQGRMPHTSGVTASARTQHLLSLCCASTSMLRPRTQ